MTLDASVAMATTNVIVLGEQRLAIDSLLASCVRVSCRRVRARKYIEMQDGVVHCEALLVALHSYYRRSFELAINVPGFGDSHPR